MSLFDEASLVVTPNGYKEGKLYSIKPTDGSGDMDVVRATTATRVNSDGLIEEVPYNLFNYSEQFDNATWSKVRSFITANETIAPDGNVTSDKITCTETSNNGCFFRQTTTLITERTTSIYVKPNTCNYFQIHKDFGSGVVFDLTNGTIKQSLGATGTIVNVGNGWFRCTATFNVSGLSLFILGNSSMTVTSWSSTVNESLYLWGAQLVSGTSAKDYFPTTDRLNIPRLDYTNGSCPSILVEPQRTNLFIYSEDFSNANWVKSGTTISINSTTSPDGTLTADALIESSVNEYHKVHRNYSPITASTPYTYSIKIKPNGRQWIYFNQSGLDNSRIWFDVQNAVVGTISNISASTTYSNAKIDTLIDGWVNISFTVVTSFTVFYNHIFLSTDNNNNAPYLGDGTSGVYIWGSQFEAGSYATSYIPTVGSSVTRNADVISKTGISDLIGQTEGTMFFDLKTIANNNFKRLSINGGSYVNSIFFDFDNSNNLYAKIFNSGSVVATFLASGVNIENRNKIAIAYKNNDFSFYVNGLQVASQTSGNIPSGLVNYEFSLGGNEKYEGNINLSALWKTRLTNSELETLTTI